MIDNRDRNRRAYYTAQNGAAAKHKFYKDTYEEDVKALLDKLPIQFSVARLPEGVVITEKQAQELRARGDLRKQGACYYKPGFPPTLDQAMMINIVTLTADEMEEVPAEEFMEILKGRLSRRKYSDCASLVQPHIRPGVSALSIARVLYQTLPPRQWAAFESAVNDTTF